MRPRTAHRLYVKGAVDALIAISTSRLPLTTGHRRQRLRIGRECTRPPRFSASQTVNGRHRQSRSSL